MIAAFGTLFLKLICDILSPQIRIPEEHSRVLVAGDQIHLCNRQPPLEETAYGLMAQVVEAEIIDACAGPQFVPGQADRV